MPDQGSKPPRRGKTYRRFIVPYSGAYEPGYANMDGSPVEWVPLSNRLTFNDHFENGIEIPVDYPLVPMPHIGRKAGTTMIRAIRQRKGGRVRLQRVRERPQIIAKVYATGESALAALNLVQSIQRYLSTTGYEPAQIVETGEGSIFATMKARLRDAVTSKEAKVLANQARQTAEAMTVDKAKAENVEKIGSAVTGLMASAKEFDTVALNIGGLTFAAYTDADGKKHAISRYLDSRDIAELEVDAKLRQPKELHDMLAELESPQPDDLA